VVPTRKARRKLTGHVEKLTRPVMRAAQYPSWLAGRYQYHAAHIYLQYAHQLKIVNLLSYQFSFEKTAQTKATALPECPKYGTQNK